MANITVTNNLLGNVVHSNAEFDDDTLTLSGAQTVAEGTILARDSVSGKLVYFVPGGLAEVSGGTQTFNLNPADTMVINTNGGGNETATFDAAQATITDTTTYPVADQDTKTMTVTLTGGPYDAVVQTVTFSGATTTAAAVAAGINAQVQGCSVAVVGGQVKITHDGAGTGMDIACGAGTGNLTWASSVAGTGDVADIDAVTAAEVKTVVEADTTGLTVTTTGGSLALQATTSIVIVSGNAVTKLGFSTGTTTANENGIPKTVLTYELAGANGDNAVRVMKSGNVRENRLAIQDGSSLTQAIKDQLRDYMINTITDTELQIQDNQ